MDEEAGAAQDGNFVDDIEQYQSKTSYVLKLSDEEDALPYNIALESVLIHHQDSVSSVFWAPTDELLLRSKDAAGPVLSATSLNDLCLLSSSFDFSVCVWNSDPETGQWSVSSALGAMTGNKHAFFGALFLDHQSDRVALKERQIYAYTYGGATHIWGKQLQDPDQIEEDPTASGPWTSKLSVKGHFSEVTDIAWDPSQQLALVSCSADQTTRILTLCTSTSQSKRSYFEISRPQVHGYDINCIACLKNQVQASKDGGKLPSPLPFKILSGGDEKVIRLFDAPYGFVKAFNSLSAQVAGGAGEPITFRGDITNHEVESQLAETSMAA